MADFLLELRSEEIPARMQAGARADLEKLFRAELSAAGVTMGEVTVWSTPRRLALVARGLPEATEAVSEEAKGPPEGAPDAAIDGFCRKAGVTRDQLEVRDVKGRNTYFAVIEKPGRAVRDVLAEAIPAIVRAFPWPKSMRWGADSISTESLRWVRPLSGILAILGEDLVECEVGGVASGYATKGHRFHHTGEVTIGSVSDYAEKLRACHVIVDHEERQDMIRAGAAKAAAEAGLSLVEDEGLVIENAGLTEWPVPLLGRFDEAFLDVPPEVIQLTARVNQKYFVCEKDGKLANAFVCTANIAAEDGGLAIVDGNRKVLAARLSDARFFWEQDRKVPLAEHARKLERITFHEKLGTVADKVERVAKLARWLVEEGIVLPETGRGTSEAGGGAQADGVASQGSSSPAVPLHHPAGGPPPRTGEELRRPRRTGRAAVQGRPRHRDGRRIPRAAGPDGRLLRPRRGSAGRSRRRHPRSLQAGRAGRRSAHRAGDCGGEFGGQAGYDCWVFLRSRDAAIGLAAIRSHLRRAAFGVIAILARNSICVGLTKPIALSIRIFGTARPRRELAQRSERAVRAMDAVGSSDRSNVHEAAKANMLARALSDDAEEDAQLERVSASVIAVLDFFADRLKVQQREAGVRHDLIDAVFALGNEDDLVRLLARVNALQSFMATEDGANLLAGYKRAANILKKEDWPQGPHDGEEDPFANPDDPDVALALRARAEAKKELSYTPEPAEKALIDALDSAEPTAAAAIEAEDFAAAMAALASLRAPIDRFFEEVTVNADEENKRRARLDLLARFRAAVHNVADFGRIEG